jgi:hypothetical protein
MSQIIAREIAATEHLLQTHQRFIAHIVSLRADETLSVVPTEAQRVPGILFVVHTPGYAERAGVLHKNFGRMKPALAALVPQFRWRPVRVLAGRKLDIPAV